MRQQIRKYIFFNCLGVRQQMSWWELLPPVQRRDRDDLWDRDQEEDERLLQDGQDGGVQQVQRQEARPRGNLPAMVTSFSKTLMTINCFCLFRYLQSSDILGYCLPINMHKDNETKKVFLMEIWYKSYITSQVFKLRSNFGENGDVETKPVPVPKVCTHPLTPGDCWE